MIYVNLREGDGGADSYHVLQKRAREREREHEKRNYYTFKTIVFIILFVRVTPLLTFNLLISKK